MPLRIPYMHNISKSRFPNYGMYYLQRTYAQYINIFWSIIVHATVHTNKDVALGVGKE